MSIHKAFTEELYCSFNSLPQCEFRLQGRTLFPNSRLRVRENKGLTPSLGKNFIVREHLVFMTNKVLLVRVRAGFPLVLKSIADFLAFG